MIEQKAERKVYYLKYIVTSLINIAIQVPEKTSNSRKSTFSYVQKSN